MNRTLEGALNGDINVVYDSIGEHPNVLEDIDKIQFVDNPIHIAASHGHTHFSLEVMRLKPSFSWKLNPQGFSPLHLALQNGHFQTALRMVEINRDLVRVQGREGITPLHYLAQQGNRQLLVAFLSANPESMQDVTIRNQTALHVALDNNNLDCVDVLLSFATKKFLNWNDEDGNTPLHIATSKNQPQVVQLLIERQVDINATNAAGSTACDISKQLGYQEIEDLLAGALRAASLLPRVYSSSLDNNYLRVTLNERLTDAAKEGNIDMLYSLLEEEPYLLQNVDNIPFVETPLHVAVRFRHFHFAMEILNWKPSFARKPNQEGHYPIHIALKNGHNCKILQKLLAMDGGNLVRLRWRENKTPLHLAAEEGDIHLLQMLLSACPLSILDVTFRNETALHITLKNNHIAAFQCLLLQIRTAYHEGSKAQEKHILNLKDEEGDTLLHIATRKNHPEVVRVLIDCGVEVNANNSVGSTALDVAQDYIHIDEVIKEMLVKAKASRPTSSDQHKTQRSEFSSTERWVLSMVRYKREMPMEVRSLVLVVSVLIATVVYQAAIAPPTKGAGDQNNISLFLDIMSTNSSGSRNYTIDCSKNSSSTNSFLGDTSPSVILFWTSNLLALISSLLTIFLILPSKYILSMISFPMYCFLYCYMLSTGISGSWFWGSITGGFIIAFYSGLIHVNKVSKRVKGRSYGAIVRVIN